MPTQPTINEGKNKELLTNSIKLLLSENTIKHIMLLAGYSKSYTNCHWRKWIQNINLDEYKERLRAKGAVFSDFMINKAFEWANSEDPRVMGVAAKVHGDITRAHLEDKTPSNITFQLQTIKGQNVSLNVDKSVNKGKASTNELVDNPEVIDITEESG